jgi:outer membrane protein TolC
MRKRFNVLLILLLSGCSYNTAYRKPSVPLKNNWTVKDTNIVSKNNTNLPYLAWWKAFDDPLLNHLIRRGMVRNTSLNMSRGNIEAAAGELKKVKLQWIPDIDFLFGYSRNPATGFPGLLALFIPSYVINIFNQVKEQGKATYELASVKAEDDGLKLTIISQIVGSYFTYQAELERKALIQVLANDLRQLADISSKVYRDGLSADIAPQYLYSQVNQIQGQKEIIERNIIVSRDAIRYLINENPGNIKTTKNFLALNNQIVAGSLPLTVLSNRPDMKMAENRLRAANKGIGIAASQLLPSITLDVLYGPVSLDSRYTTPRHIVKFNDQLLKVPALKLSVLGEIAKAKALERKSYYFYMDTLQKALRDTTNALSSNDRLTNQFTQTKKATQHLSKAYALNQRLSQQGIQSYFDTLKSKIALDKSNIDLNQAKLQQLLSIVTLYQELAGGYKVVSDYTKRH